MDFNILMNETVTRARSEMDAIGYEQLTTPEQVEEAVKRPGTTLCYGEFGLWVCGRNCTSCGTACRPL